MICPITGYPLQGRVSKVGPCIRVHYCPNLSINPLSTRLEQIAKMKINMHYLYSKNKIHMSREKVGIN